MTHPKIAIVGSGPAGFYTATELLKHSADIHVDMFDRLPALGGLARYGVSPDHVGRRKVISTYEYQAMASGRFNFYGNVEIGTHLAHEELLDHYHAVIYACGCAGDQSMGLPGENLPGSHSAAEFVGWYNGHPDFSDRHFDFSGERAIVIGNGNVALDLARMLLTGAERLQHTDIADHALQALAGSRIREVVILGRRGPAEASFTTTELLELAQFDDIDIVIDTGSEIKISGKPDTSSANGTATSFARQFKLQLFGEYATRPLRKLPKRLIFRFLSSPVAILGQERVEKLQVVRNVLTAGPDGAMQALPTDDVMELPAGLVLRAVGHRGHPIPGLPFDARKGTLPNAAGRVIDPATQTPITGAYVVGWQKRGPSGVIGTNKFCAQQTVATLLTDLNAHGLVSPKADSANLDALLAKRQADLINYYDWKTIDHHEKQQGLALGRPRVKLTQRQDMVRIAKAGRNAA